MSGSYRKVNYSVRPAKTIERKMLCGAFRRLHHFDTIESYQYVGFGSIYFSDFHLFHRDLGISNMVSIEKDANYKKRFEFNKPYKCIRIDFRPASEVLPEIDWRSKTIVWLDYEGKLNETVLSDVSTVCARASSGSVLVVSVNAHVESEPDEIVRKEYEEETGLKFEVDKYRVRELRKRIGVNLPLETTGKDIRRDGLAKISRKVIHNKIQETLSVRNGPLPDENKLEYRQIFNFHYSDGARMMTTGGVIFRHGEKDFFENCAFSELNYVCFDDDVYSIKVPCFTQKEIHHLNSKIPKKKRGRIVIPGVLPTDIYNYADLYRYFPTFAEAIFS